MKRLTLAMSLVFVSTMLAYGFLGRAANGWFGCGATTFLPMNGDLIFHTSTSPQSLAIQEATGSIYSHMGIIYIEDGAPWVLEAGGVVKSTPLRLWIGRGQDEHYVVKRLQEASNLLTPGALKRMREIGETFRGKEYDICFEWENDEIYCSELVWKIYNGALSLQVGKLETLADFDLTSPKVQQLMAKRDCGLAMREVVISPVAMFESELLETVFEE